MSSNLPPSLAVVPNIDWSDQTIEQLEAERAHWQRKIDEATAWGAAVGAAAKFRDACDKWLARKKREAVSTAVERPS